MLLRPRSWTPRSLVSLLAPHLFRKLKSPHEATTKAWRKEKVPLDAEHIPFNTNYIIPRLARRAVGRQALLPTAHDLVPNHYIWSIATGEFVPKSSLAMTQIYHDSLGRIVEAHILGTHYYRTENNVLFLPRSIIQAFDEWAITIVPHRGRHGIASFQWSVLDPTYATLQKTLVPPDGPPRITGLELDQAPLYLKNSELLPNKLAYFHACCAIWKQTCITDPACDDPAVLWGRFHTTMVELWGRELVDHSSVTKLFDPQALEEEKFPANYLKGLDSSKSPTESSNNTSEDIFSDKSYKGRGQELASSTSSMREWNRFTRIALKEPSTKHKAKNSKRRGKKR